jgi:histidinol-phosphate/aromatic aminotransferase/cobyric acid decarboxylase-like protein
VETADIGDWASRIAVARRQLVLVLRAHGLHPRPSDANWVLVDRASSLRARLAPLGVLVRDCSGFGMPDTVRVAVPDAAGLDRLDSALSALGDTAGPGS